ncbi:MAG: hypothetical protein PHD82_13030 [Candidatus Riflebacteria bacterium]|nr:hypothetical protein [Candidatus Riflebacteria bacterium]
MKHLEQIVAVLKELTERYGITITEVPERLREKVLNLAGNECADDFEVILQPLLQNFLRPIRVRAGNKVEERVVAEVIAKTSQLEGFSPELARQVIEIWQGIFKVKPVKSLIRAEEADEFDILDKQLEIKDDIKLVTDASIEMVYNPFDSVSKVVEPQVADFDGKFGDGSSERVTDFSISDAENKVSMNVESFGTAAENAEGEARRHRQNAGISNKPRKGRGGAVNLPPDFEMSSSQQSSAQTKYTIDDAFKQLRNNNFDMASKIMMELARTGNSKAQFHLGEFYLMGTGVELSEEKAKYWFRKSAAQGSFPAKQKLEDLESSEGSTGCFGCFFTVIIVGSALKLLSVLAGL